MDDDFGATRTLELLQRKYHWSGMTKDIREYIKIYDKCHRIKSVRYKLLDKFDSLNSPCDAFTDLLMNFIIDKPQFEYHKVVYDLVFLIIDQYTKIARLIAAYID